MLLLVASTALVAATGLVLAARLTRGRLTELLLAAYILSFAEIVVLSLLLSVGSSLTTSSVIGSILVLFCIAIAACWPPRFRRFRSPGRPLLQALCEPSVTAVALGALGVIAYSMALALFTPAAEQDAIEYHLARAAFWRQQESVSYIDGAEYAPLNAYPPNAEIAMALTMILTGTGRFAPLVQLVAAIATALAVFGIARRIGIGLRPALLTGFVFVTLPAVALQASTGLNDIVIASLVATAAFFLIRDTRPNLLLAGIAVALLIGSKLTGIFALPGLALIAVLAHRQRPLRALTALALGAALGSYWYVVNLIETGDPLGGISSERPAADPVAAIARVVRLGLNVLELPGAVGLDRLLFVAAAVLVGLAAFCSQGSRQQRIVRAFAAGGMTLSALTVIPLASFLTRVSQKLFYELGRADVGYLDPERSATKASPIFSWYGPLGVLLTILVCPLVLRAVRRRAISPVALVLVAAPAIWIVAIGVTTPYLEWNGGRFALGGFALAAAGWGFVLRIPPVAWATAALTLVTTTLAFVHLHDKPSGLRLLEPVSEPSVWSQPAWAVQATDHPDLRALLRYVHANIPADANLAVEPMGGRNAGRLPPFPLFGTKLSRTVYFAGSVDKARRKDSHWAILHENGIRSCEEGWKTVFRRHGWVVLHRIRGGEC